MGTGWPRLRQGPRNSSVLATQTVRCDSSKPFAGDCHASFATRDRGGFGDGTCDARRDGLCHRAAQYRPDVVRFQLNLQHAGHDCHFDQPESRRFDGASRHRWQLLGNFQRALQSEQQRSGDHLGHYLQPPESGPDFARKRDLQRRSGAETIKTNNVVLSPYTQTPPTPTPTPVSGGLFAANQVWSEFNGGSLVYGTIVSGSADLASSPIDGQNSSTSSGTVAVSTPIMNGNVATYTATVTLPLSVNETLDSSSYTAQIVATGTLQSSGTFQFDFSPRTVFWNASSGDFSAGGNWDMRSRRGRSIRPQFRMAGRARCLRLFRAARLPCGLATGLPPAAR